MNLAERLWHRPAIFAIFPFMGGIVCSAVGGWHAWTVPFSFAIFALLLVAAVALRATRPLALGLLALTAFFGGLGRHHWSMMIPEDHVSTVVAHDGRATVYGSVVSHITMYAVDRTPLDDTDGLVESSNGSFLLRASFLEIDGQRIPVTGHVKVNFYRRDCALRYGDVVAVEGKISRLRGPHNPGERDFRVEMLANDIGATISVATRDGIRMIRERSLVHPGNLLEEIRHALRDGLRESCGVEMGSFLSSLLLGFNEPLTRDLQEDLRNTGTAHFIAISGFHLVLIFAAGWTVLTLAGLRGRRQTIVLLLFLLLYTLLTGLPVSVVRSFIMIAVYLGADILHRRRDTMNALAISALIILAADPTQIFDAGFQLSYLAVLGIVHISPLIYRFFNVPETPPDPETVGRIPAYMHGALKWTALSLSISFAAWVATAPLMAFRFNLVTPVIIVANLLMGPLMLAAILVGFVVMIVAAVATAVAAPFAALLTPVYTALQWIADALARLPLSSFYIPTIFIEIVVAAYVLILLWTIWCHQRPSPGRVLPIFLLALLLPISIARQQRPDEHRLTMLDVGDGSAFFLEYPDGTTILCDAGSSTYRDVGRTIVAPFLWHRGIYRINTLILTHPDADHANGVRSVLERFRVDQVVLPKGFADGAEGRAIAEAIRRRGVTMIPVERSPIPAEGIHPGVVIDSPPSWSALGQKPTDNELSLVIRFPFDGRTVLMTGDVEGRALDELLKRRDLKCDILQAPHHGRAMKRAGDLAILTRPEMLLVSVTERHVSEEVLRSYQVLNAAIRATYREGAVTIASRDGKIATTHAIDP